MDVRSEETGVLSLGEEVNGRLDVSSGDVNVSSGSANVRTIVEGESKEVSGGGEVANTSGEVGEEVVDLEEGSLEVGGAGEDVADESDGQGLEDEDTLHELVNEGDEVILVAGV
eukprot:CAMPEP_0170489016 /NCGR_PEP_ID=MMETSP0208-20121228/7433_1 /TAXON_ID=197538 /ORGANISM="Strombidium inclinatum, Strain S3" /LENGTH=113 /DNA_ID=CAMNT_0010763767 /DNA_START=403 /DNA_END=741 /DNA_ORIENTATION=+